MHFAQLADVVAGALAEALYCALAAGRRNAGLILEAGGEPIPGQCFVASERDHGYFVPGPEYGRPPRRPRHGPADADRQGAARPDRQRREKLVRSCATRPISPCVRPPVRPIASCGVQPVDSPCKGSRSGRRDGRSPSPLANSGSSGPQQGRSTPPNGARMRFRWSRSRCLGRRPSANDRLGRGPGEGTLRSGTPVPTRPGILRPSWTGGVHLRGIQRIRRQYPAPTVTPFLIARLRVCFQRRNRRGE